ncbi:UNVERIFIED_CONTAM: hypothetical protein FKN15_027630 [Acipenser sinensis]
MEGDYLLLLPPSPEGDYPLLPPLLPGRDCLPHPPASPKDASKSPPRNVCMSPPRDTSKSPPGDACTTPLRDACMSPPRDTWELSATEHEGEVELLLPPFWPGAPLPSSSPEDPELPQVGGLGPSGVTSSASPEEASSLSPADAHALLPGDACPSGSLQLTSMDLLRFGGTNLGAVSTSADSLTVSSLSAAGVCYPAVSLSGTSRATGGGSFATANVVHGSISAARIAPAGGASLGAVSMFSLEV